MHEGWIKLHRGLLSHKLWQERPFAEGQAWIDLLLATTYDEGSLKVKNGTRVELRRGECGHSAQTLCERWGWSWGKVKRFLNHLENEKMIEQKIIHKTTIIKVLNYDAYQKERTNGEQTVNKRRTNGGQTVTIKEGKEREKRKEGKELPLVRARDEGVDFIKPTFEEVEDYCSERNSNVDPQEFYDFYSSNGWMVGKNKMADWRAALRGWEKSRSKGKEDGLDLSWLSEE